MIIGIIGAMELEVRVLKNMMDSASVEKISSAEFYRGRINGVETVVAAAGVGKVNAAVCAEAMILRYAPDAVINIGVAGGLAGGFRVCDIAVADFVVEHDMDTSALGEPLGFISGLDTVLIPCDKDLSGKLFETAHHVGVNVKRGVIASGDQFIASQADRDKIVKNFGAIAAEMEGASIGHVCAMNNVPFGVLRAISDGANDDSVTDFPAFAKKAAENSVKIILEMLSKLSREGIK